MVSSCWVFFGWGSITICSSFLLIPKFLPFPPSQTSIPHSLLSLLISISFSQFISQFYLNLIIFFLAQYLCHPFSLILLPPHQRKSSSSLLIFTDRFLVFRAFFSGNTVVGLVVDFLILGRGFLAGFRGLGAGSLRRFESLMAFNLEHLQHL